jgi:hypothetical protein
MRRPDFLREAAVLAILAVLPLAHARGLAGQVCAPTDVVPSFVPTDDPILEYAPAPTALEEIALGVGHVHYAPLEPIAGPPGDNSWVQRVALPLFTGPGGEPFSWIARGWIVQAGQPPASLTMVGMIETGYEEVSFVVLERREDWLRIRYSGSERSSQTAWVPECALDASPARLAFSPWSDWFLGDDISPLFVRIEPPLPLHAEPSTASARVATVTEADVLVPHEVRGEWMRVTLQQPSDYCSPDAVSTSREGWVRWLTEDRGPRLWYFTRGC